MRKSCPLIKDFEKQQSIKKFNLNSLKVKCEQVPAKKNADTYWAIKELSSKLKNWIK
jgi:hypothetical protein